MRSIGLHVSISGGLHKALEIAEELNINTIQIFLKNASRWNAAPYKEKDIDHFKNIWGNFSDLKIFAHSGYLINLSSEGDLLLKSINALADEVLRASQLGIDYIVLHPGSHKGIGETEGINRIAASLDELFLKNESSKVNILLETVAGQGTAIGYRFEQLRDIIDKSKFKERLEICLDTSHIFAAGYNISDKDVYSDVMDEFDQIVGLNKLKLIHLNDSKKELSSRVDRHEHIGNGFIGDKGVRIILNDARLFDIPIILETPKFDDYGADLMNLKKVYSLIEDQ